MVAAVAAGGNVRPCGYGGVMNTPPAAEPSYEDALDALIAIAGSDGSWNTSKYAQDILNGTYEENASRYELDPYMVAIALETIASRLNPVPDTVSHD